MRLVARLIIAIAIASACVTGSQLPIRIYTTADGLPSNRINKIVLDSRGYLWFCTQEGLSRFDGYGFTNYGTQQGLPPRGINDLLETRNGEYWIATTGGFVRFDPTSTAHKFTVFLADDGAESRSINAIAEDHAGGLLVRDLPWSIPVRAYLRWTLSARGNRYARKRLRTGAYKRTVGRPARRALGWRRERTLSRSPERRLGPLHHNQRLAERSHS
jgi:hypothetical protein